MIPIIIKLVDYFPMPTSHSINRMVSIMDTDIVFYEVRSILDERQFSNCQIQQHKTLSTSTHLIILHSKILEIIHKDAFPA